MEQLNLIREKCIEANPSIKDLVFGCQFLWDDDGTSLYAIFENWATKNESIRCMTRPFFTQTIVTKDRIVEILGRDIRLADVLLAIDESSEQSDDIYVVSSVGNIYEFNPNVLPDESFYDYPVIVNWNLKQDSLESQSPECIEFIANLLK